MTSGASTVPVKQHFSTRPVASIGGEISMPGDKSISHRALLLGAVAEGTTRVDGFLPGDDCLATLGALRAMGVGIDHDGATRLEIAGVGLDGLSAPSAPLDLGNSGTALRLLAGLLAGQAFDSELTGDASLRKRPMTRVAEPLRAMGARIDTHDGRAPLRIHGGARLKGIDYALPVASAQVKSALLLAALQGDGRTTVRSPAPTRDHTERMLMAMKVPLDQSRDGKVVALEGPVRLQPAGIDVPGDFSSAAFFVVAGCIRGRDGLLIRNVGVNPTRIGLLTLLDAMGAQIQLKHPRRHGSEPVADLQVEQGRLRGIDVPPDLVPLAIDELPILCVAAACAEGTTVLRGAEELRYKESDRIAVMARGLADLGVSVQELPDGLVIEGGGLRGGSVDSHGDHRIAMAFAVAGAVAGGPVQITDTALVTTSFPDFLATADASGLAIDVSEAA